LFPFQLPLDAPRCHQVVKLEVKFSKFCSKSFQRNTDRRWCVQISWNVADGKSAKSSVIYQTKKISAASKFKHSEHLE